MASMKDVAKAADVSIATVSRVLANKPNVRPEVRDRVLRVVGELNYRPNRVASNLRRQTSDIIGLLVSDIRNPFFTDIARAIEDVAHSHDKRIFLCNTDEDRHKERHYIAALLDQNAAGIILSPTPSTATHYDTMLEDKTPLVIIDRRVPGLEADYVLSDNEASAYHLTKHLIERGATRIGAVFGLSGSSTGQERRDGYEQALAEHQLQPLATFVMPREDAAAAAVTEWLQQTEQPNAILGGNLRITLGALQAIHGAGLHIPGDILIAGFDESPWLAFAGPGITTVSQPTYEMG
ncbi:MAG: LacI family DNA-binding transcriptional regulator, partial [Chloroflexota bacterium]